MKSDVPVDMRKVHEFPFEEEEFSIIFDENLNSWYLEFWDEDIEHCIVLEGEEDSIAFTEDEELLSLGITEEIFNSLKKMVIK